MSKQSSKNNRYIKIFLCGMMMLSVLIFFFPVQANAQSESSDSNYIAGILDTFERDTKNSTTNKIDGPGLRSPGQTAYTGISDEKDLNQMIVALTNFALSFATTIAMMALIYGGFLWIVDRGEEDMAEKAKKILAGAIIGILIIVSAYTLVNTVTEYFSGDDQCDIAVRTGNQINIGLYCTGSVFDENGNEVMGYGISGFLGETLGGWMNW